MGRKLTLPIIAFGVLIAASAAVDAFQNNGARFSSHQNSKSPSSSLVFQSQQHQPRPDNNALSRVVSSPETSSTGRYNGILLRQQGSSNDDNETGSWARRRSSKILQTLRRIRSHRQFTTTRHNNLPTTTESSSRSKQVLVSLFHQKARRSSTTTASSLFGNEEKRISQIRQWWKTIWKKMVSLIVALCIVFSSGLSEEARADPVDYFAPPSHSRLVPSKYQIVDDYDEEEYDVSPTEITEEMDLDEDAADMEKKAVVAAPKSSKKRAAKFESSNAGRLALERASAKKQPPSASTSSSAPPAASADTVAQRVSTTRKSLENDPVHVVVQKNKKVLLASAVVASILGTSLGVKLAAGNIGGYSDTEGDEFDYSDAELGWGPDFDDDGDGGLMDSYDSSLGGFSQPLAEESSSEDDSSSSSTDDDGSNGDGGDDGGGSSAAGLAGNASPNGILGGLLGDVGGFSQYQPSEEPNGASKGTYHNRGLDFLTSFTGYKIGYDHEHDDEDATNGALATKEGGAPAQDNRVGTFSQTTVSPTTDNTRQKTSGGGGLGWFGRNVGGFSQYQPSEADLVGHTETPHRNEGADLFSSISGYEFPNQDEDSATNGSEDLFEEGDVGGFSPGTSVGGFSTNPRANVGSFSQYQPKVEPEEEQTAAAARLDVEGPVGGFGGPNVGLGSIFGGGGAGAFSDYRPQQQEEEQIAEAETKSEAADAPTLDATASEGEKDDKDPLDIADPDDIIAEVESKDQSQVVPENELGVSLDAIVEQMGKKIGDEHHHDDDQQQESHHPDIESSSPKETPVVSAQLKELHDLEASLKSMAGNMFFAAGNEKKAQTEDGANEEEGEGSKEN